MSSPAITPPLKWHGGKHYLASRIVELMPPHTHYVEPYAGGLSVLLAKDPEGVSEAVCDVNRDLTTFWRVLRDEAAFARFCRIVEATPFSEIEWKSARGALETPTEADSVVRAYHFFVACRQSLAGRMARFAPLSRTRTRRRMNEQASAWRSAVEGLPAVHERLRRVAVLDGPALAVIHSQDGPETLFYCDPPYLHETRAATGVYGEHEMSESDHRRLLETLLSVQGKVMLSGYPSHLYDHALASWSCHTFDLPNNAAGGRSKARMTECLWCNFRLREG